MASEQTFQRTVILEIRATQHYWLGVESWTITNAQGTKVTKPALVKREIVQDKQGNQRTGKCKGFTREDVGELANRLDEIKALLEA